MRRTELGDDRLAGLDRELRPRAGREVRSTADGVLVQHLTDLGNAKRFALQHKDGVLYAERLGGFYVWDGRRYRRDETGEVIRLAPAVLQEALAGSIFRTGDSTLDSMLEAARHKILNRSLDVRRESLEKLWDAWERLQTLEPGRDKRERAGRLLDKAATEPTLRARLEEEAVALTNIGNTFMIRHTEIDKIPITDSAHLDYLFHRMFSLIRLLLKASGRGT